MKSRHLEIESKEIVVIDDILSESEVQKMEFLASNLQIIRQGYTSVTIATTSHYMGIMDVSLVENSSFYQKIKDAVASEFNASDVRCPRIIYREMVYGDHFDYHVDHHEKGHLTAIVFLNQDWDENFHGETLFSDSEGIGLAVQPRPGRMIVFESHIKHSSSAPARTYFKARKILVFNFIL